MCLAKRKNHLRFKFVFPHLMSVGRASACSERRLLAQIYLFFPHLKGAVEVSGEFDQLLFHRLADGTPVAVQGHAVHQQEAAEKKRKRERDASRHEVFILDADMSACTQGVFGFRGWSRDESGSSLSVDLDK